MAAVAMHTGVVAEFDDHRGLGLIESDAGEQIDFHCIAVADGSRRVEPGARVSYELAAGLLGRWEARNLVTTGA